MVLWTVVELSVCQVVFLRLSVCLSVCLCVSVQRILRQQSCSSLRTCRGIGSLSRNTTQTCERARQFLMKICGKLWWTWAEYVIVIIIIIIIVIVVVVVVVVVLTPPLLIYKTFNCGVSRHFVLTVFLSSRWSEMLDLTPKLTPIISSVHVDD